MTRYIENVLSDVIKNLPNVLIDIIADYHICTMDTYMKKIHLSLDYVVSKSSCTIYNLDNDVESFNHDIYNINECYYSYHHLYKNCKPSYEVGLVFYNSRHSRYIVINIYETYRRDTLVILPTVYLSCDFQKTLDILNGLIIERNVNILDTKFPSFNKIQDDLLKNEAINIS